MAEDWRLRVTLEERHGLAELSERLSARELEHEVASQLGDRVAVSRDDEQLFLYAGTEDALRAAERVVRQDLEEHGLDATIEASRWHDDAEDWEPLDAPVPQSDTDREAEHERLVEREDTEEEQQGYAAWEVRVEFSSRSRARELAEELERQGVSVVRRWKYVLVGAADEDAANQWAEQLRQEAPDGTVTVEGTFAYAERHNPFAFFGAGTGEA